MTTIIAGSRTLSQKDLHAAIDLCPWASAIDQVVCGCAVGIDRAGHYWAENKAISTVYFPAWNDQYEWAKHNADEGALIVYPQGGYSAGRGNGFLRNDLMAKYADSLILVWTGSSAGSRGMLQSAGRHGLVVHQHVQAIPY